MSNPMNRNLSRREFTRTAAAAIAASMLALKAAEAERAPAPQPVDLKIIDTHTHFYDPSRPQGVPWPDKNDKVLYRTVLPKDYRKLRVPHPVAGTVVVEASPWVEDNQWILDLAKNDPFIVGFVGNLPAGTEDFQKHLKRFAANPIFRGVRINGPQVREQIARKQFISDLHALRDHDLELDLNGGPEILADVSRVAEAVKDLRIVINHVANVKVDGKAPPEDWVRGMNKAARHPSVFCKVSALVEGSGRSDGSAPTDTDFYRPVLDVIWSAFGSDRLIYGSDWPVSERFASLLTIQKIVAEYFGEKGKDATEMVFSTNAKTAYQWIDRASQK